MKTIWLRMAALAALVFLASCAAKVERPTYADITFAHLPTINLDVAEVKVVSTYKGSLQAPHVEHEFPVGLLATAKRWAEDRLKPVGDQGIAIVTIEEASAKETVLEKTEGITGVFTTDQSERYDAVIRVKIEADNPGTGVLAQTDARVARSTSIAEDATLNERERLWYELTEKLARDLDSQLSKNIGKFLHKMVVK